MHFLCFRTTQSNFCEIKYFKKVWKTNMLTNPFFEIWTIHMKTRLLNTDVHRCSKYRPKLIAEFQFWTIQISESHSWTSKFAAFNFKSRCFDMFIDLKQLRFIFGNVHMQFQHFFGRDSTRDAFGPWQLIFRGHAKAHQQPTLPRYC